jgi:hypothetical protein
MAGQGAGLKSVDAGGAWCITSPTSLKVADFEGVRVPTLTPA